MPDAAATVHDDAVGDDLRRIAERLAGGAAVEAVRPVKSGANGQVYRVETAARSLALKRYARRPGDRRERGHAEWRALRFLRAKGVDAVPLPVAGDGEFLLMEWIEGEPVAAHRPGDLGSAASFLARIFALSAEPEAVELPPASEACLSVAEILRQIDRRLEAFAAEPSLDAFLSGTFRPALEAAAEACRGAARDGELAPGLRRLIPADFGFHNAVRQADGSLRYIDFEYFGWDDPAKVAADFVLHPAMRLSAGEQRRFIARIAAALPGDAGFRTRCAERLPLFALRWALIVLNPFRRERAGELPGDARARATLLDDRLAKARTLLRAADPARADRRAAR